MDYTERDIEDWFLEDASRFAQIAMPRSSRTQRTFRWIGRQVKVPSGVIDLLGVCRSDNDAEVPGEFWPRLFVCVVELKAVEIDTGAIGQCVRYAGDIDDAVHDAIERGEHCAEIEVRKFCVGPGCPNDMVVHEARASRVNILEILPSFSVRGPWMFNYDVSLMHEQKRMLVGDKILDDCSDLLSLEIKEFLP